MAVYLFLSKCVHETEKLQDADKEFQLNMKAGFFNRDKWKCISVRFYLMIGFFWSLYLHIVFL